MGHAGEFELLVMLAVLRLGDEAYGITVLDELERETARRFSLGAVYKTLGRLEAKDYLQCRIAPPSGDRGGRRKKLYALTPAGLSAARRSLNDLRRLVAGMDPTLELL
jgi:DNA-binding PadR family transcriptional regulator